MRVWFLFLEFLFWPLKQKILKLIYLKSQNYWFQQKLSIRHNQDTCQRHLKLSVQRWSDFCVSCCLTSSHCIMGVEKHANNYHWIKWINGQIIKDSVRELVSLKSLSQFHFWNEIPPNEYFVCGNLSECQCTAEWEYRI